MTLQLRLLGCCSFPLRVGIHQLPRPQGHRRGRRGRGAAGADALVDAADDGAGEEGESDH